MAVRILHNDHPQRSVAIVSPSHVLYFRQLDESHSEQYVTRNGRLCGVEFCAIESANLEDFVPLSRQHSLGCLGLINIGPDTFLCVITAAKEVAQVRPGEMVYRILAVEFHCVNRSDYDNSLEYDVNAYPIDSDVWDQGKNQQPAGVEHPCLALKKLLCDGTFYYSGDFDLTSRLQTRSISLNSFDIDSFDPGFMWNSHMIRPLLQFRSRLSGDEREKLDNTRFLTCVIRGFVESMTIQRPMARLDSKLRTAGMPGLLTLISRLSCRKAGTRFNARGIDDDGNVANFVETETVIWNPASASSSRSSATAVGFSYCQIRGSIPIFWEQQTGLLPNQQKIQITRSPEATQPAFDKHMDGLALKYGAIHLVNLLSESKLGEAELSSRYHKHVRHSPLSVDGQSSIKGSSASLLRSTKYDFHAETKGPGGYEAASQIQHIVQHSADAFGYFLMEGAPEDEGGPREGFLTVLQQEGVFRTNCLDCLDRTNLVQGILSKLAVEAFLQQREEIVGHDFWMRHSTLWADNGDALSKIYAGTGALKSSFTRTGKMSLAGAIADARKSATRIYINNFADKDRQNTIDVILGKLVGQEPVSLYDPASDYVTAGLSKRSQEFTTELPIHIYAGTFNVNGQIAGIDHDLSEWLRPAFLQRSQQYPELVVVGFQEIVELSPQQIMATDPSRKALWERALLKCLNRCTDDSYVLLRGGQLVGAALFILVRSSVLANIKNVEGSLKKTGMSGVAGNKGAVAIRFEYANTPMCFVTAHLAAGFSNYDERNRDYSTIVNGLVFQRGRKIDDHDAVIWLGDFNYRIDLSDEKVRRLVDLGDLQTLYHNDQLHLQMVAGSTFPYYNESRITFNPTYKYDIGTDVYDTSEKSRIPAWCDRVLWKGKGLRQLSYGCASNIRFSDHRPVFSTFQCDVSLINEVVKSKLSRELHLQFKTRGRPSNETPSLLDNNHEGDLLDLEPVASGLPAPSSEKQKWWLQDGLSAKSSVHAPGNTELNPNRPPNPFTEFSGSDWVAIRSGSPFCDVPLGASEKPLITTGGSYKKLPPPYDPSTLPPIMSRTVPAPPMGGKAVHTTTSSLSSAEWTKLNKPLIPRKPAELSNPGNSRSGVNDKLLEAQQGSNIATSSFRDISSGRDIYPPPPPRRAATMDVSSPMFSPREPPRRKPFPPPNLPPRPSSTDLMDNEGESPGLLAWAPLKPS
ncbi:SacI homology domain-containing protein [Sphaerosporella brunnea]|uniref:phosphoinositide 5-phosphatase n=1 Tax=Sphaerosporella brunnea TaxID=1250544 RepID=A0A5J5EDS0_9PEZI|nr:SacI homology domain-containing protein [Sphaerosporella brunnea]